MDGSQNQICEMVRGDKEFGSASNDGNFISISSRGGIGSHQENGDGNCREERHMSEQQKKACARIKHKTAGRKLYKQRMKRRLQKCKTRSEKEQATSKVSEMRVDSATVPQTPVGCVTNLNPQEVQPPLITQPLPQIPHTGGKEHVIDEDETDTEDNCVGNVSSGNRLENERTALSGVWDESLYNALLSGDLTSRNNAERSGYLSSEAQDNLSSGPINFVETYLALLSNDYICRTEKLVHILHVIKSCDGALDLLWNFIRENVDVIFMGERNVSHQTVAEENHGQEAEESVTDVETCNEDSEFEIGQFFGLSCNEFDEQTEDLNEAESVEEGVQVDYEGPGQFEYVTNDSNEMYGGSNGSDYSEKSDDESEVEGQEIVSAEEGDEDVTEESETESDSDTGTCNESDDYPYEEIEEEPNEEDENHYSYDGEENCSSHTGASGTSSQLEHDTKFDSVSFGNLSDLLSSFSLGSISTSEGEGDEENSPLILETNNMKKVSVGVQSDGPFSQDGYSSSLQIFCDKRCKLHKQRKPNSVQATSPHGKRNGVYRKCPYKSALYRRRPWVNKMRYNLEECKAEKPMSDCNSNTSLQNHSHCRGDACYISKQQESQICCNGLSEKKNEEKIDMKGGNSLSSCVGLSGETDVEITETCKEIGKKSLKMPNICEDLRGIDAKKVDEIPVIDTPVQETAPVDSDKDLRSRSQVDEMMHKLSLEVNEADCEEIKDEQKKATGIHDCPIWQILRHLECPFNWTPDVCISRVPDGRIQENIINHLTEKEKEFSRATCNVFREIVVHLVLVYEKTLENRLMDAIADLQHCYKLLGNLYLPMVTSWTKATVDEFDLSLVRGNYYFNETRKRRYNSASNCCENVTNICINEGTDEIVKMSHSASSPNVTVEEYHNETKTEKDFTEPQDVISARADVDFVFRTENVCKTAQQNVQSEKLTKCDNKEDVEYDSNQKEHIRNEEKETKIQDLFPGIHGRDVDVRSENSKNEFQNLENIDQKDETGSNPLTGMVQTYVSFEGLTKYVNCNSYKDVESINEDCFGETKESTCQPEPTDRTVISEDSKKKETEMDNQNLQTDINLERNYLSSTKDKRVEEISAEQKEMQRKTAMEYVVNATLAYIAYFAESNQEAYTLAKIVADKYEELEDAGKATVIALRGAMLLEYGFTGNRLGLPFLQTALKLDPDYWEWNLYCGKVLGRIRRVEKCRGGEPAQEELNVLERAVELNREDASTLVQLANAYFGLAHFKHRQKLELLAAAGSATETRQYVRSGGSSNWRANWLQTRRFQTQEEDDDKEDPSQRWRNPQKIPKPRPIIPLEPDQKDYLQLAKELYLQALKIEEHCPYNNARCAKALWSMPFPYKEKECAQNAILHALTLAPDDSLVNHYAGLFYEFCHDYEKALVCYERAVSSSKNNYPAEMNYINLKLKISPQGSYSPVFRLDKLISKYPSYNFVQQTLCHKGYYLYKVEGQLFQAIRNIAAAIRVDPGSQILKTFYTGNFYGRVPDSQNIYSLLQKMAEDYIKTPDGLENNDFIEETLEEVRSLKERYY